MPVRKFGRVLALSAVLAASPVWAGYLAAEWGMTAEQVVATSNGTITVVPEDKGKRIRDQHRLATGTAEIDGIPYVLNYFFDPKKKTLTAINFVPPKERCDDAIATHKARFGAPEQKREVLQLGGNRPPLVTVEYSWRGGMGLGSDRITGVDVSVVERGVRYCQFLRTK